MRRRSRAGGEPVKTRHRKTVTLKRRNAPKVTRHRELSADDPSKKVALFKRERDEARERETATANILGVIASSPDSTQPVFEAIVNSGLKLFPGATISIAVPVADQVTAAAVAQPDPVRAESWRRIFPFPLTRDYMHGLAILDAKVVDVPNVTNAPPDLALGAQNFLKSGYKAVTILPMMRGTSAIGALSVVRIKSGPLSAGQLALLKAFAAQAVIAIENTRLLNELRQSLQQQTATADVLKVISRSAFDLQAVLDTLVELAVRLCDSDHAWLFRRDGDFVRWAASYGHSKDEHEQIKRYMLTQALTGRGSVAGRTLLEGRPVQITDVLADPEYTLLDVQKIGNYRTGLGVPLLRGDVPIGVMIVTRSEPRSFTDKQIELLTTFADQAVIAIENVRLFEEVQARTRELSQSVEELSALGAVSQAINSTLDIEAVLTTIVAKAAQLSGTEAGTIYTFDESRQEFRLRATHGMDEAMIAAIRDRRIGTGETAIGKAAAERASIQIPDVLKETSSVLDIIVRAGYRSVLIVPLLRPDQIIGALVVRRKAPGDFPKSTVELLETFADQSVLAIQNARLFREIEAKSSRAGTGQPAQVAISCQHEPRAAHAAQRHPGLHRIDGGRRLW